MGPEIIAKMRVVVSYLPEVGDEVRMNNNSGVIIDVSDGSVSVEFNDSYPSLEVMVDNLRWRSDFSCWVVKDAG